MSLWPFGVGFSWATCWLRSLKLLVLSGIFSGAFGLASTNLGICFGAGGFGRNASSGISIFLSLGRASGVETWLPPAKLMNSAQKTA